MPEAAAAHLSNRYMIGIHSRHRSDEAGISDIHERNQPRRLRDDQHRVLLQTPIAAIIKDTPVKQRAVLRRRP